MKKIGNPKKICDPATCPGHKNYQVEKSYTEKYILSYVNPGRPLQYPEPNPETNKIPSQTFRIKYEKKLSLLAKYILNNFQKKYIYYAIDDILNLLKKNPVEQENLLAILYSPMLSLQNNLSINFFDIWIDEVYIEEVSKMNKFITNDCYTSNQFYYITLRVFYKTRLPWKKPEPLW